MTCDETLIHSPPHVNPETVKLNSVFELLLMFGRI